MTSTFFGEFDLASLSLWLFYFFFFALVVWIQRENMREGYPLEDDEGNKSSNPSMWPLPEDKTFKLPHGRGEVTVPSGQPPEREEIPMKRSSLTATATQRSSRCRATKPSALPLAATRAGCL